MFNFFTQMLKNPRRLLSDHWSELLALAPSFSVFLFVTFDTSATLKEFVIGVPLILGLLLVQVVFFGLGPLCFLNWLISLVSRRKETVLDDFIYDTYPRSWYHKSGWILLSYPFFYAFVFYI